MNIIKSFFVLIIGLVSAIYLVNPGAGIIELIPDVIPYIGNLDEAGACVLLFSSLKYFGLDLTNVFERAPKEISKVLDD